ncbi:MAG TPA: FRG domain-containing protein [Leadbetterella sp.]|nr:FRG domain-containing protein [Leadbetterella sp.]
METYNTFALTSWEEFKEIANHGLLEWVYRGQSKASWPINSSLFRSKIIDNFDEVESSMLNQFKKISKFYLKGSQQPKSLVDWLALLQHYGAPTRLIDFTKSPYIAAFFAFENEENTREPIAIWIANKNYFYQSTLYYLQKENLENSSKIPGNIGDKTFKTIFELSKTGKHDLIVPLESKLYNERYYLQQSYFLSPVNPYKSFEKQLDFVVNLEKKEALIKLTIPRKERAKALRDLEKMNISRAFLFPGLARFYKKFGFEI